MPDSGLAAMVARLPVADDRSAAEGLGGIPAPVPLLLGMGWHLDDPGGLNRYLADLFDALARCGAGPRATVIGPARDAPEGFDAAGSPSQPLLLRLWHYRVAAERRKPEVSVVDAHFALYAFWPVVAGRLRRLPLVVHFQGPWADESLVARREHPAVILAKRRLERAVYRRASVVVTLTTAFKRILVESYGLSPWAVHVVPPGVDLDLFQPGDRGEARGRLDLPTERPVVVAVRRLDARMGLDVLLNAWTRVGEQLPGSRLVIVGDGKEREPLEAMAASMGFGEHVTFLGRVDEATLVDCYRAADVTVVPTVSLEGFGLVVLESLACGTPVVVTDAGGLPETVEGLDPTTIVAAGDPGSLAAGLLRCLGDPAATPAPDRCRARADTHRWDAIGRRHTRLYADAVAQTPPASQAPSGTRRLRVVYLDHCAQLSGGELALLTLVPALHDVDAHVILGEDGPLVARFLRRGISVEVLALADVARGVSRDRVQPRAVPARGIATTAGYVLRLALRLRRLRPDVVHTNSLKSALYGGVAARLAGLPVVWHVRDRIAPDYLPPAAVRLVRAMAGRIPHRIVANSRTTLATLGPAGIDGRVIASPVRLASNVCRQPHDRPATPLRVAIVGRLAPWKGQHVFLDAFARAFPHGPEQAVVIGGSLFGEDTYGASLVTTAKELGLEDRVEFRGFCEDVTAELATVDIVVHASVVPEPFGQVVVEAMATGIPVIAADAGGPAETITDGVNGILCPPGDAVVLAAAIRRLADDPALRDRLAAAGKQRALDFAPERVARDVMDVYRGLVTTRRAAS